MIDEEEGVVARVREREKEVFYLAISWLEFILNK
jgi:hypothetical protein